MLYGEAFGPTHLVPTLWLDPVEQPVPLLLVAVAVGAVLLFVSYLLGIVNRWRESGPAGRSSPSTGSPGSRSSSARLVFAGGFYRDLTAVQVVGGVIALVGVALARAGSRSSRRAGGPPP